MIPLTRPKISVVMGVYNPPKKSMLRRCVASVFQQSCQDIELLIYDDGSDRWVKEALRGMAEHHVGLRILTGKKNRGLGYALNRCIEAADGMYIARMDADDIAKPDRLQKQMDFLEEHPAYMWCGSNCSIYDEAGIWGESRRSAIPGTRDFLRYSPYIHPSVMFRSELFSEIRYSEKNRHRRCEDYELFLRLKYLGYRGYNIQEPLLMYYQSRRGYHQRSLRECLCEMSERMHGFYKLGLMWPAGWIYAMRPIAAWLMPAGAKKSIKEYRQEL